MTGWQAHLTIDYTRASVRTVAKFEHEGPLRVLQSLYPEGDAVCHNVLVHPPSGLVGGDVLDIQVNLGANTHALLTTPGATRFYRSEQGLATQQVKAYVGDGARLEWLPLETIAYNGCHGLNHAVFDLAPSAEMMAWDITALGLPHADLPFEHGQLQQHMEVSGVWLERGLLDAQDTRLMNGPLGLAKQRCMATLVLACGADLPRERRELALAGHHARNVLQHISRSKQALLIQTCCADAALRGAVIAECVVRAVNFNLRHLGVSQQMHAEPIGLCGWHEACKA